MNHQNRIVVIVAVVIGLLIGTAIGAPSAVAPAQAQSGIIGSSLFSPLLDGTHAYTAAITYSDAANVRNYGAVQVMVANVVTGSQTITVTPQFSLQNIACASATQWFTSVSYDTYQPSVAETITSTGTLTEALTVTSSTISNTATITSGLEVSGTLVTTITQSITVTLTGGTLFTTTNGLTTSLTAGTLTAIALPDVFTITGTDVAQREVSGGGLCMRVRIDWNSAGQTYTPTVIIRGVNRAG